MGDLRDAYDKTVAASKHIEPVDAALVAAGLKIVDRIDEATATGEGQEVTKALYLVPHVLNILREMHATPKARMDAGLEKAKEGGGGKLAQLQALKGGKSA